LFSPNFFRLNFLTDLGIEARGLCIAGFARFHGRIAALRADLCLVAPPKLPHVRDSF
jgi:hypothetical protein